MKPAGLSALVVVMCVLNLTGIFLIPTVDVPPPWGAVVMGYAMFLGFVVLWFFWRAHNWARWVVMLTSILTFLNLLGLESTPAAYRIVLVIEALLGAYLLYWLNTKHVREYFLTRGGRRPQTAIETAKAD